MIKKIKINKKRLLVIIFLTAAILISIFDYTSTITNKISATHNSETNQSYLDRSIQKSLATFGILSAIKVGLAIIEGTEIGIGFGVEAGDVVQAAYDYVDIAWRVVLLSTTVLLSTKYILMTINFLDHWLLTAAFSFILGFFLIKWFFPGKRCLVRLSRDIAVYFTFITLGLIFAVPLSISGSRFLSKKITAPSIENVEKNLSDFKNKYFSDKNVKKTGILSGIYNIKSRIKQIAAFLSEKTGQFSLWLLKLIAAYLFDTIIFPLILIIFLIWFPKLLIKNFFRYRNY